MIVQAQQGDTLDLVCWRALGRTEGVVEDALLANPAIADLGPVLPIGTVVILPDYAPEAAPSRVTVQLWD